MTNLEAIDQANHASPDTSARKEKPASCSGAGCIKGASGSHGEGAATQDHPESTRRKLKARAGGPLARRLNFLRTFCLVAIALLADLEIEDARTTRDVRGSYAPRDPAAARASIWGRPRNAFSECKWDDVAFRRNGDQKFCSAKCEAAFDAAKWMTDAAERADVETETVAAELRMPPKRRTNLNYYDRRASKRKADRLTERALQKLMRTAAERRFAPALRLTWIDVNLAVAS